MRFCARRPYWDHVRVVDVQEAGVVLVLMIGELRLVVGASVPFVYVRIWRKPCSARTSTGARNGPGDNAKSDWSCREQ